MTKIAKLDQNFATVGDLVDQLLKLDPNMPLAGKGGMGSFQLGVSVRIAPAAANKADPNYVGDLTAKTWKSKANLFQPSYNVLAFDA